MKKLGLLSIIVLCFVVTGCSKNKLTCNYSATNTYTGSNTVYFKYTFDKNGKVEKYVVNEKISFNEKYLKDNNSSLDEQFKTAQEYCDSNVAGSKNISCKATKTNNAITVVLSYNIAKMSDEEITSFGLGDITTLTIDDAKERNEAQGFTCKK